MIIPAIICIVGLVVDGFVIKIFDDDIKSSRYGKQIVNTVTILLLVVLLYCLLRLILGG